MNKIFKIFLILFTVFSLTLVSVPALTFAQGTTPPAPSSSADTCESGSISGGVKCLGQAAYGQPEPPSLVSIIANIISALLALLGLIFVILIIYGGVTWMTAMGEEAKIKKAKAIIVQAAIGLIIVIASYSIATFVFYLLNNTGIGGGGGTINTTGSP